MLESAEKCKENKKYERLKLNNDKVTIKRRGYEDRRKQRNWLLKEDK